MLRTILFTSLFALVAFATLSLCTTRENSLTSSDVVEVQEINKDSIRIAEELPKQLSALKLFLNKNTGKYSKKYAVFIDMKIPSQHYRFFLVDLTKDSIVQKGIVAHGSGSEVAGTDSLIFSNTPNSYMTSLGIYKFGVAYQGSFGRSYRLHGLESSNNKAFDRAVVFHSYSYVPTEEQETPIMNSLGCPMVSPKFFEVIDNYIKKEKLPLLMKIYY